MSTQLFISNYLDFTYCQNTKQEIAFHSHKSYEIYYFHGGRCNYLIGDQIYVLSPGDLILMHGLTLHRPKIFRDEEYIRTTLHFDQDHFKGIFTQMGMARLLEPFFSLQSYRLHFQGKERKELEQILININNHNNKSGITSEYRFQLAFIDLLAYIYTFCQKPLEEKKGHTSEKEKHVQDIISYIERYYEQDISLERIEEDLHLSKFYLSKIFKEVTGATIFDYLYQKRINQAKIEIMTAKGTSMTEVSYQIGFKHPSHFSTVFKKLTGFTPEQYKKGMAP